MLGTGTLWNITPMTSSSAFVVEHGNRIVQKMARTKLNLHERKALNPVLAFRVGKWTFYDWNGGAGVSFSDHRTHPLRKLVIFPSCVLTFCKGISHGSGLGKLSAKRLLGPHTPPQAIYTYNIFYPSACESRARVSFYSVGWPSSYDNFTAHSSYGTIMSHNYYEARTFQ